MHSYFAIAINNPITDNGNVIGDDNENKNSNSNGGCTESKYKKPEYTTLLAG